MAAAEFYDYTHEIVIDKSDHKNLLDFCKIYKFIVLGNYPWRLVITNNLNVSLDPTELFYSDECRRDVRFRISLKSEKEEMSFDDHVSFVLFGEPCLNHFNIQMITDTTCNKPKILPFTIIVQMSYEEQDVSIQVMFFIFAPLFISHLIFLGMSSTRTTTKT